MAVNGDQHILSTFFNAGKEYTYKKGETILRPDDPPPGIFFIRKGYIKVFTLTENGNENLLIILKAHELFPIHWLFDFPQKKLNFQAITTVTLNKMLKKDLLDFIYSNPKAMRETLDIVMILYDTYIDRVDNLEMRNAYPRVIKRLLALAQRLGIKKENSVAFEIPITHNDIANSINMSRETASRELETLRKKGLIKDENHILNIVDTKALEEELTLYLYNKN